MQITYQLIPEDLIAVHRDLITPTHARHAASGRRCCSPHSPSPYLRTRLRSSRSGCTGLCPRWP